MIKILMMILFWGLISLQAQEQFKSGVFSFSKEVTLPGTPNVIFDAITGDISGWWDHSISETPLKMYIEPKPGGSFMEIFDEAGNGIQHAVVNYVNRPKIIRFTGPLGLTGHAISLVNTYSLEPAGVDSTKLRLDVHASGEVAEGWPGIVEKVWEHFIYEQFAAYIRAGKHLK
ncbi:MAG: hypothetical protein K9I71_13185 [Ignavibacteriales bacterium]|nr:hypothetical protein [Ignavibacteriales bacterium]MCF8317078.1 hypothetical protein [Ignavibacteriales bacterium]MCF8438653.1 hypothetical protein [Ignavibacteriales bacterium]